MNMEKAAAYTARSLDCPDIKCERATLCDHKCYKKMTTEEQCVWEIECSHMRSWLIA